MHRVISSAPLSKEQHRPKEKPEPIPSKFCKLLQIVLPVSCLFIHLFSMRIHRERIFQVILSATSPIYNSFFFFYHELKMLPAYLNLQNIMSVISKKKYEDSFRIFYPFSHIGFTTAGRKPQQTAFLNFCIPLANSCRFNKQICWICFWQSQL